MKIFKSNLTWVCLVVACIFIYGKYFVSETEVEILSQTLSAYVWIILAIMIESFKQIMDKIGGHK